MSWSSIPRRALLPGRALNVSTRPFTSSASLLKAEGPIPVFPIESANPDLASTLEYVKNELVIPAHLSRRYKQLMYRKRHHKVLEEEPLTVKVKGESWTLAPRDKQQPVPKKMFKDVVRKMTTEEEMRAVPELVMAYYQAKRPLRDRHCEFAVRYLVMNKQWTTVGQLVNRAGEIGFSFTRALARQCSVACALEWDDILANEKEGEKPLTNKASQRARRLVGVLKELEENEEKNFLLLEKGLFADPFVVGMAAGLRAKHVIKYHNGEDVEGWTEQWSKDLIQAWDPKYLELDLDKKPKQRLYEVRGAIDSWKHLPTGLRAAHEVVKDEDTKTWLQAAAKGVEEKLQSWEALMKQLE